MIDFNNLKVCDSYIAKEWDTIWFESIGDEWKDFPNAIGSEYSVSMSLDGDVEVTVGPLVRDEDGTGVRDIFDASDFLTDEEIEELINMAEKAKEEL